MSLLRLLAPALVGALALGAAASRAAEPLPARQLDGGRYGTVTVLEPAAKGEPAGFVILFSGAAGWGEQEQAAARDLAADGAVVLGVDTPRYLTTLDAIDEPCHHLPGDAEGLTRQLQRQQGMAAYRTPILAGIGQGGALAARVLAEAMPNTFAGAVAVSPPETLPGRAPACGRLPGSAGAAAAMPGFWDVGAAPPGRAEAAARLVARVAPHLGASGLDAATDDLSAIPLVELPAKGGGDELAVVISGDGGWRDIDKSLAEEMRQQGVSVIGWDSLRYFWSKRTPERLAADLAKVIRTYKARWHTHRVALVGYSFGADVLPFAYARLPPELQAKVSLVSLLGFSKAADFEIRVTGWLGMPGSSDALPTAPELAHVPPGLIQCFYGADEDDTACPDLAGKGIALIRTPGGHHFGGDYKALAQRILEGLRRPAG
jgi:type IV secretory pathway VirJ component